MKKRALKAEQHSWGERIVADEHNTHRVCRRCSTIRVTRHEPGEKPWVEFKRDGVVVARAGEGTPRCDARLEKASAKEPEGAQA